MGADLEQAVRRAAQRPRREGSGSAVHRAPTRRRCSSRTRAPRGASWLRAVLLTVLLVGCGSDAGRPVGPATLPTATPPWSEGESCRFDLLGARGNVEGTGRWTWDRSASGWRLSYETLHGEVARTGAVETNASLEPLSSESEAAGERLEVSYDERAIEIRLTGAAGASTEPRRMERPAAALDQAELPHALRAFPLGVGARAVVSVVAPRTAATLATTIVVEAEEPIEVPAGRFDAVRLSVESSYASERVWLAAEPPHLLLRHERKGTGTAAVLRSWRAAPDAPEQGTLTAPQIGPPEPVPLRWSLFAVVLVVQLPLMIAVPIVVGRRLTRRWAIPAKLWFAGALTFVASQVVHLPLNWAVGLMGGGGLFAGASLVVVALAAGLSAGLCEEVARYVALRWVLRSHDGSWHQAVVFGAGHGGIESIILGGLVALSFGTMIVVRLLGASSLGLGGAEAEQLAVAADSYFATPLPMFVAGGAERLFAMTAHVAMAVLVMRAVARRNIGYLVAAIGLHALLDALAVWLSKVHGVLGAEIGVGLVALGSGGLIAWLHVPRPARAAPATGGGAEAGRASGDGPA